MAKYIIDRRVKFKRGMQSALIRYVKNYNKFSWEEFSELIGVSDHTLRIDWGKEKSTMPLSICMKMVEKYSDKRWDSIQRYCVKDILRPCWGQRKGGLVSLQKNRLCRVKNIRFPRKNDKSLSEFIGIMLGDGHLSVNGIEISIENPLELDYAIYIRDIIYDLFNVTCKIKTKSASRNVIYLIVNSRRLVCFLTELGLKIGNKVKNNVGIPKFILEDKTLLKWCIRGLVDTDGGIFEKQKGYTRALIEFKNFSKNLLRDVSFGLERLGFTVSASGKNSIRIQSQNEIITYFESIGSSNKKNVVRYEFFIETGHIPKKRELFGMLPKTKSAHHLAVKLSLKDMSFPINGKSSLRGFDSR